MLTELGVKYHTDKEYLHNFCNFYEQNLNKNVTKLYEIGVLDGASLQMWSEYYPDAQIIGFDIEDKSMLKLNSNVTVKYLDQSNITQLKDLAANSNNVDIIIDDGSHFIDHQIMTFEILFNSLKTNGQYIIEDLHTSTLLHSGYHFNNSKGTLQYLLDIMQQIQPVNYPGQINTQEVIANIKNINIFANLGTDKSRSITAIITKN